MQILRKDSFRTMPWKNGGGETTEIAVFPQGAGMDNFLWRVSMARVATDGPFSSFPEIDRSLTLLDGDGMTLRVAGRDDVHLTMQSPPYAFPGDAATEGILTGGPILDLNVMTRRGLCRADVQRIEAASFTLDPKGAIILLLVRGGMARAGDAVLADGDGLFLDAGGAPCPVIGGPGMQSFCIRIAGVPMDVA